MIWPDWVACWSSRNVLDLYIDRRLTPRARARVAAHLEGCEACRREARALAPVRSAKAGLRPPPGLAEAILAQLESGAEPAAAPAGSLRLAPAQAAALVYLGLLAANHAAPGLPSQGAPGSPSLVEEQP
ncbi:MAG: zf-HC2 domain-containing protein [Elusimicrobia bacterium]|nr:zf-HC2 domain-containing protein [Elusimicrobiota bacterium]